MRGAGIGVAGVSAGFDIGFGAGAGRAMGAAGLGAPGFDAGAGLGCLPGLLAGVAMTGEAEGRAALVCGLGVSRDSNEAGFCIGFAAGKGDGLPCSVLAGWPWGFATIF